MVPINNTTRRYPRTLNEAFGPYQSGPIQEGYDAFKLDKSYCIVMAVCAVAAVTMIVIGVAGMF